MLTELETKHNEIIELNTALETTHHIPQSIFELKTVSDDIANTEQEKLNTHKIKNNTTNDLYKTIKLKITPNHENKNNKSIKIAIEIDNLINIKKFIYKKLIKYYNDKNSLFQKCFDNTPIKNFNIHPRIKHLLRNNTIPLQETLSQAINSAFLSKRDIKDSTPLYKTFNKELQQYLLSLSPLDHLSYLQDLSKKPLATKEKIQLALQKILHYQFLYFLQINNQYIFRKSLNANNYQITLPTNIHNIFNEIIYYLIPKIIQEIKYNYRHINSLQ